MKITIGRLKQIIKEATSLRKSSKLAWAEWHAELTNLALKNGFNDVEELPISVPYILAAYEDPSTAIPRCYDAGFSPQETFKILMKDHNVLPEQKQ